MNEKVKQTLKYVEELKLICREKKGAVRRLNAIETELNNCEKEKKELVAEQHRLFDLAKEQESELEKLKEQYKNIHNTKVKVPLCNILNGLSRKERERVIEDIYYSQAERQELYENKISKLETALALSWRPIKEYFEEPHDWVLVQFKEKDTDFMPIPIVAEYRRHKNKWFPIEDDNSFVNYLNDICEPVAFMQIPHYKKVTVGEKTAKLELNKKELYHLQNDLISQIYDIKKAAFGDDYDMGCKLSDREKSLLTKEKETLLKSYGYYSRLELKEKLDKFEEDNFMEDQYCGG